MKDHHTDTKTVTNQPHLSVNLPGGARLLSLVSTSFSVVSSLTTLTHCGILIFSLLSHSTSQPIVNLINQLSWMMTQLIKYFNNLEVCVVALEVLAKQEDSNMDVNIDLDNMPTCS